MDTQLKELIETIKAEGVQGAEKQAQQIITSAEEKSEDLISQARARAAEIVEQANSDRARQEAAGKEAVKQAARDLLLNVQSQLTAMFRTVVENAVEQSFDAGVLERAVETVIGAWAQGTDASIDVLLSEKDLATLESSLRTKLADYLRSGAEIKAAAGIQSGFRVSTRDGVYYDFTVDAVAEGLCAYVTPRLAETIREAAKDT